MLNSQLGTPIHKPPVLIFLNKIKEMLTNTHKNVRSIFETFIRREMEQVLSKKDLVNASLVERELEQVLVFSNDHSLSIEVSHNDVVQVRIDFLSISINGL